MSPRPSIVVVNCFSGEWVFCTHIFIELSQFVCYVYVEKLRVDLTL